MSSKNLMSLQLNQQTLVRVLKFVALAYVLRRVAVFLYRKFTQKRLRSPSENSSYSINEEEEAVKQSDINSTAYNSSVVNSVGTTTPVSENESSEGDPQETFNSTVSFVQLAKVPSEMEEVEVIDGKTAAAYIAYAFSEIALVYPLTEKDYLGEVMSEWSAHGGKNAFSETVKFSKMETKNGAGGALHGALAGGAVVTGLTSSEAIPFMIPNLKKIANGRLPTVLHVQARGIDNEKLTNMIDHSSLLSSQNTGSIMISSSTPQEVHDLAIASHLISFETKLPVIHFFDGVRTSDESVPVQLSNYSHLGLLLDNSQLELHRQRNSFSENLNEKISLDQVFSKISSTLEKVSNFLGRSYKPFDYFGDSKAETVIVMLSSGSQTTQDIISYYSIRTGQKIGLVKVRIYRPWSSIHFINSLPKTVQNIIVIDQVVSTLESNISLYQDVVTSLGVNYINNINVISTTLSHSLTEIKPSIIQSLVKSVTSNSRTLSMSSKKIILGENEKEETIELSKVSGNIDNFISGTNTIQCSIWDIEQSHSRTAYQSILNIIGKNSTGNSIQSHVSRSSFGIYNNDNNNSNNGSVINYQIRLGDNNSNFASYSLKNSDFTSVNDISILSRYNVLEIANKHSIFLLNTTWTNLEDLQIHLPNVIKKEIASKKLLFYPINASTLAPKFGLDPNDPISITAILQTIFFKLIKLDQALYWHQHILQLQQINKKNSKVNNQPIQITLELLHASLSMVLKPLAIPNEWLELNINEEELNQYDTQSQLSSVVSVSSNDNNNNKLVNSNIKTSKWHQAAWSIMFPEAFETKKVLRPDAHHSYLVTLTENRRLTPEDYDRYVFHLEFDTKGTGLKYEIGDALGVYGHNDEKEVSEFLNYYGLNSKELVVFHNINSQEMEQRTIEQVFTQYLDIFGRPSKRFYQSLSEIAQDKNEKEKLEYLISSEGSSEFKKRVEATVTFADILKEFTSARPSLSQLIQLIDPIKPRHYSIASSMRMHPNSVHLLVVLVDWMTPNGEKRFGQCTRYLSSLQPGTKVTVSVKPSVMKLPPLDSQPVIMAGLGTGMAPFRAFIEERAVAKREGKQVGPMILYFGSRHRVMEYLYGEELEAYHQEGLLTHLRLAFSRDQKEKIYIQNKIAQDDQLIHDYLLKQEGHFYLCGPTWPAGDVRDAIATSFSKIGNMTQKQALKTINDLKDAEKYILEVY